MTEPALELRLLLSNLALELLNDKIDRAVHILRMLLTAQQDAADDGSSHFYLVMFPLNGEQDRNLAHVFEILRDLADALFHIVAQCGRNLDIFSPNRECSHETQPLSIHRERSSLHRPPYTLLVRHGCEIPCQVL